METIIRELHYGEKNALYAAIDCKLKCECGSIKKVKKAYLVYDMGKYLMGSFSFYE